MHVDPTLEGIARGARKVSLVVGVWLFLSAFFLRQTTAQAVNHAVVGAIAAISAYAALQLAPKLRLVNVVLALWLFAALLIIPGNAAGVTVSDMVAAALLFGCAVVPDRWDEEALAL